MVRGSILDNMKFGFRKDNKSFEFGGGILGIKSHNLDSGKKTKVLNLVGGGILGIKSHNIIWAQERKPKF